MSIEQIVALPDSEAVCLSEIERSLRGKTCGARDGDWRTADGDRLLRDRKLDGRDGAFDAESVHGPDLEAVHAWVGVPDQALP
jgi:hypothetical protein